MDEPGRPDAPSTPTPFGAWRSSIRIDDVVGETVRLAEPWVDHDDVYWLEGRPVEAGRSVLVRRAADGSTADVTPAPFDVRSQVHEYGGGSYAVDGGIVVFSDRRDGRLYRLDPAAEVPVPITPPGPWRYADLRSDRGRRRFLAVREEHRRRGEPRAAIVDVPLDGDRAPRVLVSGPDFLAAPRPSPDGTRLAWLEWDHPDMPWDATRLRVAEILGDGRLGRADLAAGGPEESVVQPEWSPDGVLHLVSDRSGWWNLYRLEAGPRLEPLAPTAAEFADPPWIFDRPSYGFLADGSIVAVARSDGRDRLVHIIPGERIGEIDAPYTELDWLRTDGTSLAVIAASPSEAPAVVALDPTTLAPAGVLRRSTSGSIDAATISTPESITFPTTDGVAHASFYPPRNPAAAGPADERPPLVVRTHGGPTSNATSALALDTQLLTSRGLALVDVDYRGSTGYGRAYREALQGAWGIADVHDAVAAARYLAERGDIDPGRVAIEGSSAGGYTTLRALTTTNVFAAGISTYGIGDLDALGGDTHKFESRYLERLVGDGPGQESRYRERSPIHALDRIDCPVLILQGLDDRVVPPSQAEALVAALAARGIPYAYRVFEGEGHGFRGAAAIRGSIEARLAFLGAVFGFRPADDLAPLEVVGLDAWRGRHRRGG